VWGGVLVLRVSIQFFADMQLYGIADVYMKARLPSTLM